jgi:hydroxymethylbilane synthase
MMKEFVIGTRGSPLAVTQTGQVCEELRKTNPTNGFSVRTIQTSGDMSKSSPIGSLNLKGAFTKELDEALLGHRIDIAVHSLKDLPAEIPAGLTLAAVTRCVDPRDVWLSASGKKFNESAAGSVVGTSSMRRRALLARIRPDLKVEVLRGNVDTRLRKLSEGKFDAIIVAAAGLKRLGLEDRVTEFLAPNEFVPAIGQGRLAIVTRQDDSKVLKAVRPLDDEVGHQICLGERQFMLRMEGGCQIPLGCYGEVRDELLTLSGFWASMDGGDGARSVLKRVEGPLTEAIALGDRLASEIRNAAS